LSQAKRNCYAVKKVAANCAESKTSQEVWISVKVSKVEGVDPLSNTDNELG